MVQGVTVDGVCVMSGRRYYSDGIMTMMALNITMRMMAGIRMAAMMMVMIMIRGAVNKYSEGAFFGGRWGLDECVW